MTMTSINLFSKRILLVGLLASMLGGCAVYEPMPAGYYAVNADGSKTYVAGTYTCPAGYTCTSPAYYPAAQPGYVYSPNYYAYPPGYVAPYPYFWPPLFFGVGYYGGYHHHRR
jgi:hypothetical protein